MQRSKRSREDTSIADGRSSTILDRIYPPSAFQQNEDVMRSLYASFFLSSSGVSSKNFTSRRIYHHNTDGAKMMKHAPPHPVGEVSDSSRSSSSHYLNCFTVAALGLMATPEEEDGGEEWDDLYAEETTKTAIPSVSSSVFGVGGNFSFDNSGGKPPPFTITVGAVPSGVLGAVLFTGRLAAVVPDRASPGSRSSLLRDEKAAMMRSLCTSLNGVIAQQTGGNNNSLSPAVSVSLSDFPSMAEGTTQEEEGPVFPSGLVTTVFFLKTALFQGHDESGGSPSSIVVKRNLLSEKEDGEFIILSGGGLIDDQWISLETANSTSSSMSGSPDSSRKERRIVILRLPLKQNGLSLEIQQPLNDDGDEHANCDGRIEHGSGGKSVALPASLFRISRCERLKEEEEGNLGNFQNEASNDRVHQMILTHFEISITTTVSSSSSSEPPSPSATAETTIEKTPNCWGFYLSDITSYRLLYRKEGRHGEREDHVVLLSTSAS